MSTSREVCLPVGGLAQPALGFGFQSGAEKVKNFGLGVLCGSPGGAAVNGQCVETNPKLPEETELLFQLVGRVRYETHRRVLGPPVRPARLA